MQPPDLNTTVELREGDKLLAVMTTDPTTPTPEGFVSVDLNALFRPGGPQDRLTALLKDWLAGPPLVQALALLDEVREEYAAAVGSIQRPAMPDEDVPSDEVLLALRAEVQAMHARARDRVMEDLRRKPIAMTVTMDDCADKLPTAEALAQRFHEHYETLAPAHGYRTREASAVAWADVPEVNKGLMVVTAHAVLEDMRRGDL